MVCDMYLTRGAIRYGTQIVFLLTAGRIQAKFSSNASYDLRDLLGATHNVLAGELCLRAASLATT